jgi:hypothetical protein
VVDRGAASLGHDDENLKMKWLLALALMLGTAPTVWAAEPDSQFANKNCPMTLLASLDVRVNQFGQVLVPASMAGHDVWFSLAMQGGILSLYDAAVADWHLKTMRMNNGARYIVMEGKRLDQMVRQDFTLGPHGFTNWAFVIVPKEIVPATYSFEGKPIVGQLTTVIFMAVDAEISIAQNKMNLFSHTKCGENAIYWGGSVNAVHFEFDDSGLLHFPMQLDNQEVDSSFDTSQKSSRISTEVTKKFFGSDQQSPDAQNGGFRAMGLTATGLDIQKVNIELWPTDWCRPDRYYGGRKGIECTGELRGVSPFAIGTDLMKQLHIYIASKENTLYFTRAESHATNP